MKIRLRRQGARNAPTYRVVVADAKAPRDGRFLEILGHYNPRQEPPVLEINSERALYWLGVGAQPTEAAHALLRRVGVLETFETARDAAKAGAKSEPAEA